MKLKTFAAFLGVILFLLSNGQEYYKIFETNQSIRYYNTASTSIEKIDDSLSIIMEKKGSYFNLSLVKKDGILLVSCMYKFSGNYETQTYTTRITDIDGSKVIRKRRKVKVLKPLKESCIKYFLLQQ